MDKKEQVMYQEISKLSNSKEFVEAMRKMDIQQCEAILRSRPRAINSVDHEYEKWTAIHYAVDN